MEQQKIKKLIQRTKKVQRILESQLNEKSNQEVNEEILERLEENISEFTKLYSQYKKHFEAINNFASECKYYEKTYKDAVQKYKKGAYKDKDIESPNRDGVNDYLETMNEVLKNNLKNIKNVADNLDFS